MSNFGLTIGVWRRDKGLTQKTLAKSVGVSPQYMNDIERGRRNAPPDALLEKLAVVLGCPTHYLYYRADRIPPEYRGAEVLTSTVMVAWERFQSTLHEEETL